MSWRLLLERAAGVDARAGKLLPPLIRVLEAAERGEGDDKQLREVLGLPSAEEDARREADEDDDPWERDPPGPPPFLAALDAAARTGAERWDTETLAAARLALRELGPLLSRLASIPYGAPFPPARGPESVEAALDRLERGGDAAPIAPAAAGALVCPRCRSTDVEQRSEDAPDEERLETRCRACGLFVSLPADDPDQGGFQRAPAGGAPGQAITKAPAVEAAEAVGSTASRWVDIPGGRYRVGLDPDQAQRLAAAALAEGERTGAGLELELERLLRAALPAREIELDAYQIAAAPVTNEAWSAFMRQTGAPAPDSWVDKRAREPRRPVLGVSWDQASAFARWAGAELPSEAQWERAARGTPRRLFAWGDEWGARGAWTADQHYYVPWVSAEHPELASPDGCLDMTSGHWEWCADPFTVPAGAFLEALVELFPGLRADGRVRRGGPGRLLPASTVARTGARADWMADGTTFRLARRPPAL